MNDKQLLRYSRHILLDDIGIEGQQKLLASHALVIGSGGLGCPAALYLASSGVGSLTLVDGDRVDASNLQRQIGHTENAVGELKTASLARAIAQLNSEVKVRCISERADDALLSRLVAECDVVLDCTDNFATRQAINRAAVLHGVPLVSGAAIGFDAQISVFDPRAAASPCYACVFPATHAFEEVSCAAMGVVAPLVGVVGSLQALEAVKLLASAGTPLVGRLLMLDGLSLTWTQMQVQRDPNCAVCASRPSA
jgi:molybdopterin-synthase adenylyltransferase